MGKRGPKPAGKLTVIERAPRSLPQAPPGMTPRARYLFYKLVRELPADHFRPGDIPLLREFCEAYNRSVEADKALKKDGHYIPSVQGGLKAHPAIAVKTAAGTLMATLATKLRICNSTKSGGRSKDAEQKPKSRRAGLMFGGKE